MENATLYMTLAQVALPKDLLENFEISKIETQSTAISFKTVAYLKKFSYLCRF